MKKVLVTGVSGFVGQHCAAQLLKKGYAVKGSLRSLGKSEEVVAGMKKEVGHSNHLEFCALDLLSDDGWDRAMEGCDFVLHVASPFVVKEPKNEDELIRPALQGTLRALNAAKKAGVKRMVITSSTVAMFGGAKQSGKIEPSSWANVGGQKN